MFNDTSVKTAPEREVAADNLCFRQDAAWRKTLAAALRVIDHHRANLDAHVTIRRLRRHEQSDPMGAAGPPGGR